MSTSAAQLTSVPPPAKGASPAAPPAEKPKSKKKLFLIVGVVLLLLVGVVLKGKLLKPHFRPGEVPPAGAVVSLGTLTTTLSDGHLVQATIQLQLTVAETAKVEAKDQPQLLNAATATLGDQTYGGLLVESGRTALKAELLKDFQSVLDQPKGPVMVDAVFLTSFVVQ